MSDREWRSIEKQLTSWETHQLGVRIKTWLHEFGVRTGLREAAVQLKNGDLGAGGGICIQIHTPRMQAHHLSGARQLRIRI